MFRHLCSILPFVLTLATNGVGADPLLRWRFDGESQPKAWEGKFGKSESGPRPPRYPGFDAANQASALTGHEGWIVVKDHQRGGFTSVRFGVGDTFAFEAWVKFRSIDKGNIVYLMGKGRHPGLGEKLGEENQNYSIRFEGTDNGGKLGFLFTSRDPKTKKTEWHRWWSEREVPARRWHHVALQYTFGESGSLRAERLCSNLSPTAFPKTPSSPCTDYAQVIE